MIHRQPFPGPGLAIRVLGEVTEDRLKILREADVIVLDEMRAAGSVRKSLAIFRGVLPIEPSASWATSAATRTSSRSAWSTAKTA